MHVLLLNGSPHERGCTYTALRETETALNADGVTTEWLQLGKAAVQGCVACGLCAKHGRCCFNDGVNTLLDRLDQIDGIVIGSPVYYAAPAGQLTAFLDRAFYAGGDAWRGKPGAAVVSCRRGGAATAFDRLNKYFSISSMPIVSSQYWNMIHGNTPQEAAQDIEGLQTMRTLGHNMAWLLKCIDLGRSAGVTAPMPEAQIYTNFIR